MNLIKAAIGIAIITILLVVLVGCMYSMVGLEVHPVVQPAVNVLVGG